MSSPDPTAPPASRRYAVAEVDDNDASFLILGGTKTEHAGHSVCGWPNTAEMTLKAGLQTLVNARLPTPRILLHVYTGESPGDPEDDSCREDAPLPPLVAARTFGDPDPAAGPARLDTLAALLDAIQPLEVFRGYMVSDPRITSFRWDRWRETLVRRRISVGWVLLGDDKNEPSAHTVLAARRRLDELAVDRGLDLAPISLR